MDDPVTLQDRYSSAVRSSNLKSNPRTTKSDSDVLGAAGFASKHRPLAIALMRLFVGDNHASRDIVELLTRMVVGKAWHGQKMALPETEARDISQAVLAWHRDGVCKACGGHGYMRVDGAPTISDQPCGVCRGTGKVPFDKHFKGGRRELAQWLVTEIEREQAAAGQAAMAALAPRLEP